MTLIRTAKDKPSFITVPESDIFTKIGERLVIQFSVEGFPRPNIICFKESKIIETNERFHLYYNEDNVVSIVFEDTLPYDSGIYSIVVKNEAGYNKYSFNLTVEGLYLLIFLFYFNLKYHFLIRKNCFRK